MCKTDVVVYLKVAVSDYRIVYDYSGTYYISIYTSIYVYRTYRFRDISNNGIGRSRMTVILFNLQSNVQFFSLTAAKDAFMLQLVACFRPWPFQLGWSCETRHSLTEPLKQCTSPMACAKTPFRDVQRTQWHFRTAACIYFFSAHKNSP